VVGVDPYRPLRVVVDAILRHIIAGLLWERVHIFQAGSQLVRKAPEVPVQQTVLPLIAVKTAIDGLVPAGIKASMETHKLVLHMEIVRRFLPLLFCVVVNDLFFENGMNVSL
jgi:hypothetical protein